MLNTALSSVLCHQTSLLQYCCSSLVSSFCLENKKVLEVDHTKIVCLHNILSYSRCWKRKTKIHFEKETLGQPHNDP